MEDNNMNEPKQNVCFESHCWKKCLAMICAAFLGGFLAFYFVTDQMMHKYSNFHRFNPHKFERRLFDDVDRMYRNDIKAFEDAFRHNDFKPQMKHAKFPVSDFMMDSVKIKTEFDDDKFKVIVGLKPFQDNADNINYNVNGRKLTVYGSSEVKDKIYVHDVSFSQDFILPENADISAITKTKDGHKLIISVPLKD